MAGRAGSGGGQLNGALAILLPRCQVQGGRGPRCRLRTKSRLHHALASPRILAGNVVRCDVFFIKGGPLRWMVFPYTKGYTPKHRDVCGPTNTAPRPPLVQIVTQKRLFFKRFFSFAD